MDNMTGGIKFPTYPTGSFNYLRRLQDRRADTHTNGEGCRTRLRLEVIVVGAGVGGLSTAIALGRKGHNVTIYEAASVLSEVGAGIHVPPNSSRILHSWGLKSQMDEKSIKPEGLVWRRWQDGKRLAHAKLNPRLEEWLGSPYYSTHRAHLHQVLYQAVVDLGIPVRLSSRIWNYDIEGPPITLEDGSHVHADLVVAADGVRSQARRQLCGESDKGPRTQGTAVYRAVVDMAKIRANPQTAWIAERHGDNPTLSAGHNTHAMCYTVAGGELYNMVLTFPDNTPLDNWDSKATLEEMKSHYKGWDPSLTQVLDMVTATSKWPVQMVDTPKSWCNESGTFLILGDAAHAMFPSMALGGAMAVEDAAALAECLDFISSKEDLKDALAIYEDVRMPRVKQVQEASELNGQTMHLADGPEQEAMDAAMRPEVEGTHYVESPNQWSDPTMNIWAYAYDVMRATREACEKQRR